MRTTAIRGAAAAVLLSATVLGLAGCVNAEKSAPPGAGESQSYGNPPSTQPSTPAQGASQTGEQHNQTDVTFLTQGVRLREQAVTVAGLAGKSTNTQVRALATELTDDTVPSTDTMTGWLTQWNQPAPASVPGPVPGLLTDAQVQQLGTVSGTSFDMQWLQGIKSNLTAAQQLSDNEAAHGSDPQAKQLAQQWSGELKTELGKLTAITG